MVGICPGGICPAGICPGGICPGGICPAGICPDTICIWQISQIQTCLFKVVGTGLVSTSPAFVSNSAIHPAGPHGRNAQKNCKLGHHCWGRESSTPFAQQLESAVTAPLLVGGVVWSLFFAFLHGGHLEKQNGIHR